MAIAPTKPNLGTKTEKLKRTVAIPAHTKKYSKPGYRSCRLVGFQQTIKTTQAMSLLAKMKSMPLSGRYVWQFRKPQPPKKP